MRVRFYGRSDVGRKRLTNEDSFILCEAEGLGVVCDGMGGHEAGEVASRMAVDLFLERAAKAKDQLHDPALKLSQARALAQDLVVDWTREANARIHQRGKLGSGESGVRSRMGTTLALVLFVGDCAVVCHVGDTRVYRVRAEAVEQLTQDHIIVADARRAPSDPRPPRKRKFVTRALGTKPQVEPDVRLLDVALGDVFVLCSDGLHDLVDPEEILKIVTRAGPNRSLAVRSLIDLANKRGGVDNVTVVLAEALPEREDDDDDTDELPLTGSADEPAGDD